jgi:hypothetical protein
MDVIFATEWLQNKEKKMEDAIKEAEEQEMKLVGFFFNFKNKLII